MKRYEKWTEGDKTESQRGRIIVRTENRSMTEKTTLLKLHISSPQVNKVFTSARKMENI